MSRIWIFTIYGIPKNIAYKGLSSRIFKCLFWLFGYLQDFMEGKLQWLLFLRGLTELVALPEVLIAFKIYKYIRLNTWLHIYEIICLISFSEHFKSLIYCNWFDFMVF